MSNTDHSDSVEAWLSDLRAHVEPTPAPSRQRVAGRLAQAGLMATLATAPPLLTQAATALPRPGLLGAAHRLGVALTLPLGIVLGAAGYAWLAPPLPSAPASKLMRPAVPALIARVVSEPLASSVAPPSAAPPSAAPQVLPPPVLPRLIRKPAPLASASEAASAPSTPAEPPLQTSNLAAELRLLERARAQLSGGQPEETLELLRAHRSAFPASSLAQEREVLSIKALAAAGRADEARSAASAFVQRYPNSVLRASVERAVGTIR